jgi:transposase
LASFDSATKDILPQVKDAKSLKAQRMESAFNLQNECYRVTGVNLIKIDGIDSLTALKVVSEIGLDMERWKSAKYFASWLGSA